MKCVDSEKLESAIDGRSCFEHFIECETEDREEIKNRKEINGR